MVDDDQGVSGSKIGVRIGFPQMLQLIESGRVSAVFTVHVDRFARNLLEFAQLTTVCDRAHVPWVVDGRVIDLAQGGDRLLAMMMGVFAEHENRDRMQKLQRSRLAKIQVQRMASGAPPAGYDAPVDAATPASRRSRWGTQWQKSLEPGVADAITAIFAQFQVVGTVGGVIRAFRRDGLHVPCRITGGLLHGTVQFQPPTYERIHRILTNPCYTDAFVYQKKRCCLSRLVAERVANGEAVAGAPDEWVLLPAHHEAYLSWTEYWQIQAQLCANRTRPMGAPRRGSALLGRVIVCAHCGYAMLVSYGRRGGETARGYYHCPLKEDKGRDCHNISAMTVDGPVLRAVLAALARLTEQAVHEALARERSGRNQQRQLQVQDLQQAQAAVALAERRYKAVDPDNRLVAQQVERDYEAARRRLEHLRFAQSQAELPPACEQEPFDVQTLLAIAADVQRVWEHPAVTYQDRKEVLRALLDRVVFREPQAGVIELALHWHGGAVRTIQTYRTDAVKYRILELWQEGRTAHDIAATLNVEGLRTAQQRLWSKNTVELVLYTHARPTARWQAVQQRIRELHGQGLRCGPIAAQLNAEGLRVLSNEQWRDNTVGIELHVLGLPKPQRQQEGRQHRTESADGALPAPVLAGASLQTPPQPVRLAADKASFPSRPPAVPSLHVVR